MPGCSRLYCTCSVTCHIFSSYPQREIIHTHNRHLCAKAVGRWLQWCPHLGSPIRQEMGSWAPTLIVGDERMWGGRPWGGDEETAAGAPDSPL